jgi:hypothetical protein
LLHMRGLTPLSSLPRLWNEMMLLLHLRDAHSLLVVMPHLAQALPLLCRGLMKWTAHALFKEFCVFMGEHYGANWWAEGLTLLCFQQVHDRIPLRWKCTRGVEEELSKYLDGDCSPPTKMGLKMCSDFFNSK